jgi:rhodanese-related sulfurtransferase
MQPPERVPSITVHELSEWMQQHPSVVLLDIREPFEIRLARLNDQRVAFAPLSILANAGVPALPEPARDPQAEIVVFCHHGVRSVEVVAWLREMGWQHVVNLLGGIEAYASEIDRSVGFY